MTQLFLFFFFLLFFSYPTMASLSCPVSFQPVCAVTNTSCVDGKCTDHLWTYGNSCIATSAGYTVVSEGACTIYSRPSTSTKNTSMPNTQTDLSAKETQSPTVGQKKSLTAINDLAAMLTTDNETLGALRTSIVNKVMSTPADQQRQFLEKLVQGLQKQYDGMDKNTENAKHIAIITDTIKKFLAGTAQNTETNTDTTTQKKTTTENVEQKTGTNTGNTGVNTTTIPGWSIRSSSQRKWTSDGKTIKGKRLDEEITITPEK